MFSFGAPLPEMVGQAEEDGALSASWSPSASVSSLPCLSSKPFLHLRLPGRPCTSARYSSRCCCAWRRPTSLGIWLYALVVPPANHDVLAFLDAQMAVATHACPQDDVFASTILGRA